MNQRMIGILSLAALACIVVGGVLYVQMNNSRQLQNASNAPLSAGATQGAKAPTFSTPTTAGPFDLASVDKPVFLEVFATWCPHCQRETRVLNQLYGKYKDRVAFIAIPGSDTGMDGASPESLLDVLNFQTKFRVAYPIAVYDPALTIPNQYLKGGFPTIAVIDKNKTISYLNSGEIGFAELDGELGKVIR
jgi:thiol-disulfide isomerase/thioredoxin